MSTKWIAAVALCVGAATPAAGQTAVRQMELDEVLEAARRGPVLARLASDVAAAEARLVEARTYPHNPEVSGEAARRRGDAGASTTDVGFGLAQRIELAGQRSRRRAAAEHGVSAARASFRQARRTALAQAARAFAEAAGERELLASHRSDAELARRFAELTRRRVEAGSATAVEEVLARAGLARAERQLALARGLYRRAQAALAEAAGLSDAALVVPVGELPRPQEPPSLDALLETAADARGDLAAARARVAAGGARVDLARAERIPDLTAAVRAGREEGDDILGLGLMIPIPLFDRNEGAVAEADAELAGARAELAVAELAVHRDVAAARERLAAALEALDAAERLGLDPLEEGLELLERAFDAGKIGSAELLLYRRELVEARRQSVEARVEAVRAAIELALATGATLPGTEWLELQEAES